jgi:hypothetical protein
MEHGVVLKTISEFGKIRNTLVDEFFGIGVVFLRVSAEKYIKKYKKGVGRV